MELTSNSAHYLSNYNPASNEIIEKHKIYTSREIDEIIQSAQDAYKSWSTTPPVVRARILNKAALIIRERIQELAYLEVLDTGKPIYEAENFDIPSAADAIEYFAGVAQTVSGAHHDFGNSFAYLRREPIGVCAGIGAWNYPFQIACWKSAPALACGNTFLFKPSELTPTTALKLQEIYEQAGLPKGVFRVVTGDKNTGAYLAAHPKVRKISLTGSVATGKKIMSSASENLKHISLELGGKSPLIIFDDCDLDQAVNIAMNANFFSQGEVCSNGTRIFVHEKIYDAFLEKFVDKTKKIKIGDPLNPETRMGALISKEHLNRVLDYIEIGKKQGATILTGGHVPNFGELENSKIKNGNFLLPTIFTNVNDDMIIAQQEIFGPVACVFKFQSESEVIERANNTEYALAAGIVTKNLSRAHKIAAQLQAGVCWINNYNVTPVEVPFGGMKSSGIGRENGLAAIEAYTQLKTVYVEMDSVPDYF